MAQAVGELDAAIAKQSYEAHVSAFEGRKERRVSEPRRYLDLE